MKSLLFVVNEAGEFVELSRVALAAKTQGYSVSFLFAQPGYINLRHNRAFCRLNGFKDYYPGKKLQSSARVTEFRTKEKMLEDGYLPYSLLHNQGRKDGSPTATLRWTMLALSLLLQGPALLVDRARRTTERVNDKRQMRRFKPFQYAKSLYEQLQPDLVVFGQEFPGSVNSLLTRLCIRDGVPTLIIPFAVGTTKEMVESLADKPDYEVHSSVLNRLAASLYPHWVNYYAGKALLRLPGKTILILEALGLAPEHPWLPNSSKATCIAVESKEMEKYYRRMQFPDSQLRLTGAAYDDRIAATRSQMADAKQKLCRQLRLDPAKPLLVCAWPTDQFGSRFIPLEFNNYEQLCKAWAKTLALVARLTDYNIVIRPHPVTDPDFLTSVLRPYRLHHRITDIDTLELVPVCDLFIACVSSTLRWAISCGIPAINYDCYDYGYTDFDSAPGLFTVKKYGDFDRIVQRLTEDPTAYAEAKRAQEECAAEWGLHDGKSMDRILHLIGDLAASDSASGRQLPAA